MVGVIRGGVEVVRVYRDVRGGMGVVGVVRSRVGVVRVHRDRG